MSHRVEHADALTLLCELPGGWAQTCIARPPRDGAPDRTLAILTETRRVLRDDGTLWLLAPPDQQQLLADLQAQDWKRQTTPAWATRLTARTRPAIGLFLFSKNARYFYDADTIDGPQPRPLAASWHLGCGQSRYPQRCAVAFARERDLRLVRSCVLAGSSPLACGQCGAPYRRKRPNESAPGIRRPTCRHNHPGGNCLVLDPFYTPSLTSTEAVLCTGRNFLGIKDTASTRQAR